MKLVYALLLLLCGCATPSKTEGFCLPKRITPSLLSAFLLAFAATSNAQMVEVPVTTNCHEVKGQSMCLLPEKELDDILEHNNRGWEMLARALNRIRELEAAGPRPKCAETEITEPSKNAPPAPKKIPYVKPERRT